MTEDECLASDITLLAGIRDSGGKHACDVLWNSLGATFGGSEAAKRRARKLFSKYLPASDPGIDSYSPAAGPLCERAGRARDGRDRRPALRSRSHANAAGRT